ncbi:MAG TPA: head GIN domain-containing protein [Hanamia sp.]|nr:head GIN domain-containing protein [Hanamia sp.]
MKKLLFLLLMFTGGQLLAQPWKSVTGNGNLKKESRTVSTFNSLASYGAFDVKIAYGNPGNIQVEADENLLPFIETTVENGKLEIRTKNHLNVKSKSKIVVYVSMTKINALQLSGSGNIDGNGTFTSDDKTKLMLSGSGNIHLTSGSYSSLNLAISGSGNLVVKDATADNVSVEISGSGNADCSEVSANQADVKISGSGNARVNVNKSLTATISGSGNVYYKGNATDISTKSVGSGKAIKI